MLTQLESTSGRLVALPCSELDYHEKSPQGRNPALDQQMATGQQPPPYNPNSQSWLFRSSRPNWCTGFSLTSLKPAFS